MLFAHVESAPFTSFHWQCVWLAGVSTCRLCMGLGGLSILDSLCVGVLPSECSRDWMTKTSSNKQVMLAMAQQCGWFAHCCEVVWLLALLPHDAAAFYISCALLMKSPDPYLHALILQHLELNTCMLCSTIYASTYVISAVLWLLNDE